MNIHTKYEVLLLSMWAGEQTKEKFYYFDSTEELIGAVGGVNESVAAEHLSDVEWRDDNPLFMFNDENVTKPQTPASALTPVQTYEEEDKVVSSLESPLGKKPCFQESIAERLLKTAPTCLKPNYNDSELVGFT